MSDHGDHAEPIRVDDLEITPGEGLVRAGGQVLTLSVREFQLLVAMVAHAGAIIGREELTRVVWGRQLRPGDRSVDVYVSKLRAKFEHAMPSKRYIHTHPSFGYRFQPEGLTLIDGTGEGEPSAPGHRHPHGASDGGAKR